MAMIQFLVNQIIGLYILVIFVSIILSWLVSFNVVNRHNQFVDAVGRTCQALTEPLLQPIRSMLPAMGGIDLSPVFLIIGLQAVQIGLNRYVFFPAMNAGY
ncbi:MAG: YggT family protein [Pseudomonadota bacterium]